MRPPSPKIPGTGSCVPSLALLAPRENGKAGLFTGRGARAALKTKEQIKCCKHISFPVRSVPRRVLQQEPFFSCVWINAHAEQLPCPGRGSLFPLLFILILGTSPHSEHHTPNSKETGLRLRAQGAAPPQPSSDDGSITLSAPDKAKAWVGGGEFCPGMEAVLHGEGGKEVKQRREMAPDKSWNVRKGLCVGDCLSVKALQQEPPLRVSFLRELKAIDLGFPDSSR